MANEDKRIAVGFSTTLSGQLIAAATGVLAIECAYISYVWGSRMFRSLFVIFAVLAAILIICSIHQGGKGIVAARNAGFHGNWDLKEGKKQFNAQAICLIGAFLMLSGAVFFSGPSKESKVDQKIQSISKEMARLRRQFESNRAIDVAAKGIEEQLAEIKTELQKLRPTPSPVMSQSPGR